MQHAALIGLTARVAPRQLARSNENPLLPPPNLTVAASAVLTIAFALPTDRVALSH